MVVTTTVKITLSSIHQAWKQSVTPAQFDLGSEPESLALYIDLAEREIHD